MELLILKFDYTNLKQNKFIDSIEKEAKKLKMSIAFCEDLEE